MDWPRRRWFRDFSPDQQRLTTTPASAVIAVYCLWYLAYGLVGAAKRGQMFHGTPCTVASLDGMSVACFASLPMSNIRLGYSERLLRVLHPLGDPLQDSCTIEPRMERPSREEQLFRTTTDERLSPSCRHADGICRLFSG